MEPPMEPSARTQRLLDRLDAIGASLAQSGHGLALIGLGSVGEERQRLDEYSDLDFFAIVQPGYKDAFIGDLGWLERVHPIDFAFQNTALNRLEARAVVQNARGNGALRKLGAVQEGVLRGSLLKDGKYLDQIMWSILSQDWFQAKAVWSAVLQ